MYPPTVEDVPVRMNYPPWIPAENKIAIGQEVFGLLPGLGMYATLWLREHNRVCDILKAEHPTWDDEQLFQTARLVIIGEMTAFQSHGRTHWEKHSFSCLQYLQKPYFVLLVSIKSSRHQLQSTNQSNFISIAFFHRDKF